MCEFEDTVMTKCGHLFCKECILESLNVNNLCPTCRKPVESGGLLSIDNDQEKKEEIVEEVKDTMIEKYGTKLATLIKTVRQILLNKENKIIIFSQWDMLLALIGKSLKENGVANTFIKGNVYCRNKAISKFKMNDNDSSVIMLSLENAASGTNLTEASHIIFIEPVDKEVEEIKAIEGQAIGRVCRIGKNEKVKIIRIITENTIEEDIYNEKYL
jgi:SWI/SNF-related matrix-associated actin-dependent regulator of chromatin subfamily A3